MYVSLNKMLLLFSEVSGSYAENQKIMTLRKVYQVCLKNYFLGFKFILHNYLFFIIIYYHVVMFLI